MRLALIPPQDLRCRPAGRAARAAASDASGTQPRSKPLEPRNALEGPMHKPDTYQPIEDHGIVGDLHSVALVGKDGSVDFMCFPDFDSPSIFASLLDARRGGHFSITPLLATAQHRQLYLSDSAVLLTRFLSADGVAEISDFMPVEESGPVHSLIRRVKTVRGEIRFRMTCAPRFDYGRAEHHVEHNGCETIFVSDGND